MFNHEKLMMGFFEHGSMDRSEHGEFTRMDPP